MMTKKTTMTRPEDPGGCLPRLNRVLEFAVRSRLADHPIRPFPAWPDEVEETHARIRQQQHAKLAVKNRAEPKILICQGRDLPREEAGRDGCR